MNVCGVSHLKIFKVFFFFLVIHCDVNNEYLVNKMHKFQQGNKNKTKKNENEMEKMIFFFKKIKLKNNKNLRLIFLILFGFGWNFRSNLF